MKIIATYEKFYGVFNPSIEEKNNIIQDCEDILLELSDDHPKIKYKIDYEWARRLEIGYTDFGLQSAKIIITFSTDWFSSNNDIGPALIYKDIEDYILRLIDYLGGLGLKYKEIGFGDDVEEWKKGKDLLRNRTYRIEFFLF